MSNPPSREEINEMSSFMDILNEKSEQEYQRPEPQNSTSVHLDIGDMKADIDRQNKQAMAGLLEGLNGLLDESSSEIEQSFSRAAKTAATEAQTDPAVREAIETQKTATGFIYGEWELLERADKKKTYYTIRHTGTQEILAKDLLLREAALSLVKLLNTGLPINSPKCFEALNNDMRYRSALFDMAAAKRKKGSVAESKYEAARDRALNARQGSKTLLENLRKHAGV